MVIMMVVMANVGDNNGEVGVANLYYQKFV